MCHLLPPLGSKPRIDTVLSAVDCWTCPKRAAFGQAQQCVMAEKIASMTQDQRLISQESSVLQCICAEYAASEMRSKR